MRSGLVGLPSRLCSAGSLVPWVIVSFRHELRRRVAGHAVQVGVEVSGTPSGFPCASDRGSLSAIRPWAKVGLSWPPWGRYRPQSWACRALPAARGGSPVVGPVGSPASERVDPRPVGGGVRGLHRRDGGGINDRRGGRSDPWLAIRP